LSVIDLVLNELAWIPIGLFFAFAIMKYQKFSRRNQPKQRGYYGGEGHLSSFPDENTDRQRQNSKKTL
jgi:hypothetical protein